MADVKVSIHPERLKKLARRIARDEGVGAFMSTEAARGMDPYVPYRDGTLSASADTSRPFHVVYGGAASSYASIVYDGVRDGKPITIHKDKHPKATKQWDKAWWRDHKGAFCKSVAAYIERMF